MSATDYPNPATPRKGWLLFLLALDGSISRLEGGVLFSILIAYTTFLVVQSRRETKALTEEYAGELHLAAKTSWDDRLIVQLGLIAVGLAALVLGSRWLVGGATEIARLLGVSELVIGLTIVAAGTSLPEVAASVAAAVKGQRDIAVGNVVGSNTFNILGVLGLSALAAPSALTVATSLTGNVGAVSQPLVAESPQTIRIADTTTVRCQGLMFSPCAGDH